MSANPSPEFIPHTYFTRAWTDWCLADFAKYYLELTGCPPYQLFTSTYTNSLDAIHRNTTECKSRRAKALLLRERWNSSSRSEQKLAKQLHANLRPALTVNGVVINGNVTGNVSGTIGDFRDNTSGSENGRTSPKTTRLEPERIESSSEEDNAPRKKPKKKRIRKPSTTGDDDKYFERFTTAYGQMTTENKWILATGRAVEDIIYTATCKLQKETIAHSFILNPEDAWFVNLFEQEEWKEILVYLGERREMVLGVSTPQSLDLIPNNVTTTRQLRDILYSAVPKTGPEEEWVDAVYRQFLFLMEHPDKPLTHKSCENWLEVTVWSLLINRGLMTTPSLQIQCKEAASVSTRRYHNHGRTTTGEGNYLLPGPRLDAIYRLVDPDFEFGGCEVGKTDGGPEDTKRLDDFKKLVITLRHMVSRIHREVTLDPAQEKEIQAVGLTFQALRLHCPSRYVCLVVQDKTLRVPANPQRIRDIQRLLHSLWLVKKTLSDTMALVMNAD